MITGFIFPKYSVGNADPYNEAMRKINSEAQKPVYMMPILESGDIVEYSTRHTVLSDLKRKIQAL